MGNYTILYSSKILGEAGKQEILTTNVPKILDFKSSYEQIFSENWRWVSLMNFEDDAESTVSNDSRYIENIVNWINNQSIFR